MIAALKQHYECYHAGDLTALKKLYEYHAENCAKAAELTGDTQQREGISQAGMPMDRGGRCAPGTLDAKYRRTSCSHGRLRRDAGSSRGSK